MAWRPSEHLIEGELDNTTPCRVTGWMRFAGMKNNVTFDLKGDSHRDIRGAKIRLRGEGQAKYANHNYMEGFSEQQTGDVGDITTGVSPSDYAVGYPYVEWYSEENGRVVVELDADQVEVIGQPIPACESDPVSREQQGQNIANFLSDLSSELSVPAVAPQQGLVSNPRFSHWVTEQGRIIGEARDVKPGQNGTCFAYVRLFAAPEMAEHGSIDAIHLRPKTGAASLAHRTPQSGQSFLPGRIRVARKSRCVSASIVLFINGGVAADKMWSYRPTTSPRLTSSFWVAKKLGRSGRSSSSGAPDFAVSFPSCRADRFRGIRSQRHSGLRCPDNTLLIRRSIDASFSATPAWSSSERSSHRITWTTELASVNA